MKRFAGIVLLAVVITSCATTPVSKIESFYLMTPTITLLDIHFLTGKIDVQTDEYGFYLLNDTRTISVIVELLGICLRIGVNLNNIENIDTTRASDGDFYPRLYVSLGEDGVPVGLEKINDQ